MATATLDYDRGERVPATGSRSPSWNTFPGSRAAPAEHYVQQDDGCCRFTETDGLGAEIDLPSLDATLPISEIYLDTSFDTDEHE